MYLKALAIAGALLVAPAAYANDFSSASSKRHKQVRGSHGYFGHAMRPLQTRNVYLRRGPAKRNMSGPGNESAIHDSGSGGGDGR